MRSTFLAIMTLAFCCAPALAAVAEPQGDPLVSVNGFLITTRDLDSHLRMLPRLAAHASDSPASTAMELDQVEAQRRRDALHDLIERRLLYDVARADYLGNERAQKAVDAAADDELRRFEERVGSMLTARRVLAEVGLTVEQYKELQRQNLLTNQLLWDKVFERVDVAPGETRQYYDGHPAEFAQPRTVVFRQMLFIVVNEGEELPQRARAEAALGRLRAGEEFTRVAKDSSADTGTDPTGLCRVGIPDATPDWLPPAVAGLKPGETSDVRRLSAGFSIARLEKFRPAGPQPFEEVQPAIKEALLRFKRAVARAAYLDELKAAAHIEYLPAGAKLAQE